MPYHVAKSGSCPPSKPWACLKDSDGEVMGCHADEAAATKQMAALYANEAHMNSTQEWYRITNKTDVSEVYLYNEVGAWGVSADDFVKDLQGVASDRIDLHLNSPGGDFFAGLAIFNALRNHPGEVTVYIDGLAASAASFIAMAGDKIVAERNAQMMIHEANTVAVGSGTVMRKLADHLDRASTTIAGIYAGRAGGSAEDWLSRMRAETWYTAAEAKTAGLVDEVTEAARRRVTANTWDLSIFNYAGREAAPDPFQPPPQAAPSPEPPDDPADEPGFLMPPIEALRASIHEAVDPHTPIDLDALRSVIRAIANDAPAPPRPPAPTEPADEPGFAIDLSALRRSLREATL